MYELFLYQFSTIIAITRTAGEILFSAFCNMKHRPFNLAVI